MSQQPPLLHLGLADFAEPTLLLLGDASAIRWLADAIEEQRALDLAELPGLVSTQGIGLRLVPVTHGGRLSRRGSAFDWEISATEARQFARQLRGLAAATTPAHAYLDPDLDAAGVQIVASVGEYDPTRVFAT